MYDTNNLRNRYFNLFAVRAVLAIASVLCCIGIGTGCLNAFELQDPVPLEEGATWERVSDHFGLLLRPDDRIQALRLVIDDADGVEPVYLPLEGTEDRTVVENFLLVCQHYLENLQKSPRVHRAAILAVGGPALAQVRCWADEIARNDGGSYSSASFAAGDLLSLEVIQDEKMQLPSLVIDYRFDLPSAKTYGELRKLWVLALIQKMVQTKLDERKVECRLISGSSSFLLPHRTMRWEFSDLQAGSQIAAFLETIQEIRRVGFSIEELVAAKNQVADQLMTFSGDCQEPVSYGMVAFHAEGFLRNLELLSYRSFLESTPKLVDSITPLDLAIVLHECFPEQKRTLHLRCAPSIASGFEEQVRGIIATAEAENIGFQEMVTELSQTPNFFQLLAEPKDKEKKLIEEILRTMARESKGKLLLKATSLYSKGKKIDRVHPLSFLGFVFTHPELPNCMRQIREDTFKWWQFMDGIKKRLAEESNRNGLAPYLSSFCYLLKLDESHVRHLVDKGKWEDFVVFILKSRT